MTGNELIKALLDVGGLDDEVLVRCEVTSSYGHPLTGVTFRRDEHEQPVFLIDVRSGIDRPLITNERVTDAG